jgi:hypothetical protein
LKEELRTIKSAMCDAGKTILSISKQEFESNTRDYPIIKEQIMRVKQ